MYRPINTSTSSTTIVTCIEAGGLEDQVVLLARSLRRLGGLYANLPIVAIKARAGPPLRRRTRRALNELDVRFVDKPVNSNRAWWAHANKPAALLWADQELRTQFISWMDSDMLVLRELDPLTPPEGCDFIARAGEGFDVASSGSDDKALFWRSVCAQQGLDFSTFPTIESFPDQKLIKAYWQAGLFTFRRGTAFAPTYNRVMNDLLAGNIGSRYAGVYHTDQVALAVAVQAAITSAAQYRPTMNLNLNDKDPSTFERYPFEEVKIVHYHGSFYSEKSNWAIAQLSNMSKEQVSVLNGLVPLSVGGFTLRLHRKFYETIRSFKIKAYHARVKLV